VTENKAREEICRVGQSLFERGYVHATAEGGYLITPTDACLGFLDPAKLARLDRNGEQVSGDRGSKTIVLHRKIYEASASTSCAARCIIHTHSTHCVSLSMGTESHSLLTEVMGGRELLAALTPYFVMKVGHVPVIDYRRPGDPQAALAVAQAIARYSQQGTPIRAVMLARLGPNVWHESPASAMATLEELEETARLRHLTQGMPKALSESNLQELRETFGAIW
jgi:ribulose-5-phosphate 4-epimerase/fuculose-1-phosphate aldolase